MRRDCTPRELTEEEAKRLANALAPLMFIRNPSTDTHFHDDLIFALAGTLYWRCYSYHSAAKVAQMLISYALEHGEETERDAKEHMKVVAWVYERGPKGARVRGWRHLQDTIRRAATAAGVNYRVIVKTAVSVLPTPLPAQKESQT